jgi:hypothetical protein
MLVSFPFWISNHTTAFRINAKSTPAPTDIIWVKTEKENVLYEPLVLRGTENSPVFLGRSLLGTNGHLFRGKNKCWRGEKQMLARGKTNVRRDYLQNKHFNSWPSQLENPLFRARVFEVPLLVLKFWTNTWAVWSFACCFVCNAVGPWFDS